MNADHPRSTRRSIRVPHYDYSQPGAYFVTICAEGRRALFGKIVDAQMRPDDAGTMITDCWLRLPFKFPTVELDQFVLMPNHLHGIVVIAEAPDDRSLGAATALGMIVAWFKTMTTNACIRGVKERGWSPFRSRLWQRNYYEHIIRGEKSLDAIREYIAGNPANWAADRENPAALIAAKPMFDWQV